MQGPITVVSLALAGLVITAGPAVAQHEEVLQESSFDTVLAEYVTSHPGASLSDVASFASARVLEHGLDYVFDLAGGSSGEKLVLEAGERRLVAAIPNQGELGACGEHWLSIPAVHADVHSIEVVFNGERITVQRPEYLHLNSMVVYTPDQETVITKVDVPWQTLPFGVSRDGNAVLISYALPEETLPWWSEIRKRYPQITLSSPLLLLAVDTSGTHFNGDPDLYVDPYANNLTEQVTGFTGEKASGYLRRVRFKSSGLVVEYQGPCT